MGRREGIFAGSVVTALVFVFALPSAKQGAAEPAQIDAPILPAAQGDPLPGLSHDELVRFQVGRRAFLRFFFASGQDGGGPLSNNQSCSSCHTNVSSLNAVGGSQNGDGQEVKRFGRIHDGVFDPLVALGGPLLQARSVPPCKTEVIPSEANVQTVRTTPHLFGSGLVESLEDSMILRGENQPETGGIAHKVFLLEDVGAPPRVGRFGWKAQLATLLSFAGDAASNELGITNKLFPLENQPNLPPGDRPCSDEIKDKGLDDRPDAEGRLFIERVRDFMRYLAPPPQTPKAGMVGEKVFQEIGCAKCHTPRFTTPDLPGEPAFSKRTFQPYSDYLLHDMGDPLAGGAGDGITQGDATGRQIRTAPLWDVINRIKLFHDGRIRGPAGSTDPERSFREAIAAHEPSPEAAPSVVRFNARPKSDQSLLLSFLLSLGRVPGDHNGDFVRDGLDRPFTVACQNFKPQPFSPDDSCAISDVDQDGDVDDGDVTTLFTRSRQPLDCDCNGIVDEKEISLNQNLDQDFDLTLDRCRISLALILQSRGVVDSNGLDVLLTATGIRPGADLEFFYGIAGEKTDRQADGVNCVNIRNETSLSRQRADADGRVQIRGVIPVKVLQGHPGEILFQARVSGEASAPTEKSRLLISPLRYGNSG